jgi:S-adenosylmethionine synthetase
MARTRRSLPTAEKAIDRSIETSETSETSDMQPIHICRTSQPPVARQPLEIVERKGLGHPDTICDLLVESISEDLCQAWLDRTGRILHYNLDKALLVAGTSQPEFGGGRVTHPLRLVLGDRATTRFDHQTLPLDSIIDQAVNRWFAGNLRHLDAARDLVIQNEIQPGSAELSGIFQRDRVVANDTSAAVGYAPLSETEQLVIGTERWLNSAEMKQRFPAIGEDIKLMAVRQERHLGLTVALAFVDRHVTSVDDYFQQKLALQQEIHRFLTDRLQLLDAVTVQINTLDDAASGKSGIYLTVTGTSAECGDSGQVGRGNNVRGLISLHRPVANEAAAGKNPVSHIGKIYNLLSYRMADQICRQVEGVQEAYVWLVSQIGQPITRPWLASARLSLQSGTGPEDVEQHVHEVIRQALAGIPEFCDQLIRGRFGVSRSMEMAGTANQLVDPDVSGEAST